MFTLKPSTDHSGNAFHTTIGVSDTSTSSGEPDPADPALSPERRRQLQDVDEQPEQDVESEQPRGDEEEQVRAGQTEQQLTGPGPGQHEVEGTATSIRTSRSEKYRNGSLSSIAVNRDVVPAPWSAAGPPRIAPPPSRGNLDPGRRWRPGRSSPSVGSAAQGCGARGECIVGDALQDGVLDTPAQHPTAHQEGVEVPGVVARRRRRPPRRDRSHRSGRTPPRRTRGATESPRAVAISASSRRTVVRLNWLVLLISWVTRPELGADRSNTRTVRSSDREKLLVGRRRGRGHLPLGVDLHHRRAAPVLRR